MKLKENTETPLVLTSTTEKPLTSRSARRPAKNPSAAVLLPPASVQSKSICATKFLTMSNLVAVGQITSVVRECLEDAAVFNLVTCANPPVPCLACV